MVKLIFPPGNGGRMHIPLATRLGTQIDNELVKELPPVVARESAKIWKQTRPDAVLRSTTAVYNCLGLIFASRRTWIEQERIDDLVDLILLEDGFRRIGPPPESQIGDLVIYRRLNSDEFAHIGIIYELRPKIDPPEWKTTVLSKWGKEGEYLHPIEHVPPWLGEPAEYWTDRRQIP